MAFGSIPNKDFGCVCILRKSSDCPQEQGETVRRLTKRKLFSGSK